MKFVNRGYLLVRPKQAFIDWINKVDDEFGQLEASEPNVYLIEDDFFDEEPLVKSYFKKIFLNELFAVCEDKEQFPEITEEVFHAYFELEFGTSVFDLLKSDLVAD